MGGWTTDLVRRPCLAYQRGSTTLPWSWVFKKCLRHGAKKTGVKKAGTTNNQCYKVYNILHWWSGQNSILIKWIIFCIDKYKTFLKNFNQILCAGWKITSLLIFWKNMYILAYGRALSCLCVAKKKTVGHLVWKSFVLPICL